MTLHVVVNPGQILQDWKVIVPLSENVFGFHAKLVIEFEKS